MSVPYICGDTIDDLVRRVICATREHGQSISPGKGAATELTGVLLELSNPRARLSATEMRGKLFSGLGELCWYLAGSDEIAFIKYYVSQYDAYVQVQGINVCGAYGPRLFNRDGRNQMEIALQLLRHNPSSRRAILVILEATDLSGEYSEVPCTCTLQLFLRNLRLDMIVTMRSNDVYKGLIHDIFSFTMLQEIAARALGVDVGSYKHFVGSLHIYDNDNAKVDSFLQEGWQSKSEMPAMPEGDPWPHIALLLDAEARLRKTGEFCGDHYSALDPYWQDLIALLRVFSYKKQNLPAAMRSVRDDIASDIYRPFIDGLLENLGESASSGRQSEPNTTEET